MSAVTNLRPDQEEVSDVGPDGVSNLGWHYSCREADEIIRSLKELGVTVAPFFNGRDQGTLGLCHPSDLV